jgi:hypothetical protein
MLLLLLGITTALPLHVPNTAAGAITGALVGMAATQYAPFPYSLVAGTTGALIGAAASTQSGRVEQFMAPDTKEKANKVKEVEAAQKKDEADAKKLALAANTAAAGNSSTPAVATVSTTVNIAIAPSASTAIAGKSSNPASPSSSTLIPQTVVGNVPTAANQTATKNPL